MGTSWRASPVEITPIICMDLSNIFDVNDIGITNTIVG